MISLHETCRQYVARRLSEGWRIILRQDNYVILSIPGSNILRPVDLRNDVETLRPNADGDKTEIEFQSPDSTFHWDKVDEAVADEFATYLMSRYYDPGLRDLYNIPNSAIGAGVINSVTLYLRCAGYDQYYPAMARFVVKTNGIEDAQAPDIGLGLEAGYTIFDVGNASSPTWRTGSYSWVNNPQTGVAWTWAEINALQIGLDLRTNFFETWRRGCCTQVYVEVNYTPGAPGWSGKIAGVTNPAKIMGVDKANISKVKGVVSA